MGKTTDILLATVVIEMPASDDERAMIKNITINRKPINMERKNHGWDKISAIEVCTGLIRNPKTEATM